MKPTQVHCIETVSQNTSLSTATAIDHARIQLDSWWFGHGSIVGSWSGLHFSHNQSDCKSEQSRHIRAYD